MSGAPAPPGLRPGGRHHGWRPHAARYVILDVDGTLVGRDGVVSPAVRDAVRATIDDGIAVGVATGRMRLAVEPLSRELGAPGPHILHNGAEVRVDDTTIASWPLTDGQLAVVLQVARTLTAYVEIYVPEGFVVTRLDERARPHWEALGHEPLAVVSEVDDIDGEVLKATFALFGDVTVEEVLAAIEATDLKAGAAGAPVTPDIDYVNVTRPDADKGVALRHGVEYLGTTLADTVAVGDAPNDLPMLRLAGTAVAMADAPAEIREVAHLIAPAVDDDGAAVVLEAARRGTLTDPRDALG